MPLHVAARHQHHFCTVLRTLPFHEEVALVFLHWQEEAGATAAFATTHDSCLLAFFATACQSSTSQASIHAFSQLRARLRTYEMGHPRKRSPRRSALPAYPVPAP